MGTVRRRIAAFAAVAVAAGTVAVAMPFGSEAAGNKSHTAAATGTLVAGAQSTVTLTVTNTSQAGNMTGKAMRVYLDNNPFGGGVVDNIGGPGEATLVSASDTDAGTNVALNGNTSIDVTNLTLKNKGTNTYTLTFVLNIPCSAFGAEYTWVTDLRQSNDFNPNNTSNQIPIDPAGAYATSTVTVGCGLNFTNQPADAYPGETISTVDFDPSGSNVIVSKMIGGVVDTTFNGLVTLAATSATISGNTATAVNGVATFPNLKISNVGTYQLVASSPGELSGTSNSFDINYGFDVDCVEDDLSVNCTATATGRTPGTFVKVTVNEAGDGDSFTGKIKLKFTLDNPDCPGFSEFGDTLVFGLTQVHGDAPLTKTVELTKPIDVAGGQGTDPWDQQACFQAPYQFLALPAFVDNAQANYDLLLQALAGGSVLEDATSIGGGQFRGLLPRCSLLLAATNPDDTDGPCLQNVETFQVGGTWFVKYTATVPAADPTWK